MLGIAAGQASSDVPSLPSDEQGGKPVAVPSGRAAAAEPFPPVVAPLGRPERPGLCLRPSDL
jgi:hypothetical protein